MINYDREKILDFLHSDEVAQCESLHDVYELYLDVFDSHANSLTQVLIIDGDLTPQEIIDGMTECDELFDYLFSEVKYPTRCNLKIPPNIKLISKECFSWCDWLVSVSGEHVEDIEGWAFYRCANLKYGYFPNTIGIGQEAFLECKQLSDINVQSLYTTDKFVFYGCANLTNLILPNLNAEATYANSFQGCSNLVLSLSKDTVDEWENTTELNDLKEEVKEIKII